MCGGRLQCYVCFPGGTGQARPHTLQLPGLLQGVQPGQAEGGVSVQGRTEEEEAEEQAQALPPYAQQKPHTDTHSWLFYAHAELSSHLFFLDVQPDLMTSSMLRPWMPFAIGQSASTWQRTSRAWAMDTAWCSTARCLVTHTHTRICPNVHFNLGFCVFR